MGGQVVVEKNKGRGSDTNSEAGQPVSLKAATTQCLSLPQERRHARPHLNNLLRNINKTSPAVPECVAHHFGPGAEGGANHVELGGTSSRHTAGGRGSAVNTHTTLSRSSLATCHE